MRSAFSGKTQMTSNTFPMILYIIEQNTQELVNMGNFHLEMFAFMIIMITNTLQKSKILLSTLLATQFAGKIWLLHFVWEVSEWLSDSSRNPLIRKVYFCVWTIFIKKKKIPARTSLVVQWLRIRLPMQGTRVRSLAQADSTCHKQLSPCTTTVKLTHHSY